MSYILIAVIQIYRILVPRRFRRECIFRDSCSHHVAQVTRESGFLQGLIALSERYRNCRGGYKTVWVSERKNWALCLMGGAVLDADDVSPSVRKKLGF